MLSALNIHVHIFYVRVVLQDDKKPVAQQPTPGNSDISIVNENDSYDASLGTMPPEHRHYQQNIQQSFICHGYLGMHF